MQSKKAKDNFFLENFHRAAPKLVPTTQLATAPCRWKQTNRLFLHNQYQDRARDKKESLQGHLQPACRILKDTKHPSHPTGTHMLPRLQSRAQTGLSCSVTEFPILYTKWISQTVNIEIVQPAQYCTWIKMWLLCYVICIAQYFMPDFLWAWALHSRQVML